jgi:L-aminopeptidase/D-esterase-like protein
MVISDQLSAISPQLIARRRMLSYGMRVAAPAALAALLLAVPGAPIRAAQSSTPAGAPRPRGLTEVQGIRVGSYTLPERPTGCTVVLIDGGGAPGGVSQRGGAPGTSETDLLHPLNMVDRVNAFVLSGGSAYGLDARQGVMRFLEQQNTGWRVGPGVVPIVPAAILFDLPVGGNPSVRPTAECGYRAARDAHGGPVAEGNVGAGAGATVGKTGGGRAMKGGLGSAAITLSNGLVVAAIAAVNAAGDVVDPETATIVAGARTPDGRSLADARKLLRTPERAAGRGGARPGENTTIAVVATNARLTKTEINRVALMADDGLARAINPSHTAGDGDTVFSIATGRWDGQASVTQIGALAAEALAEAIVRAVAKAESISGYPSAAELGTVPARLK